MEEKARANPEAFDAQKHRNEVDLKMLKRKQESK
jgi:hypothetical protein